MQPIHDESRSSYDLHIMRDLMILKRWDVAMTKLRTNEGRDSLRNWDVTGCLPIHQACHRGAPLHLVEAMLWQYRESVEVMDGYGLIPLHWACSVHHVSPQIVSLILGAYPEGAKATDRRGRLPLHRAAKSRAPSEVLLMLMNAHPEGAASCNRWGLLPVHVLAEVSSPDEEEDVDKVEVLLRPLLDDEEACLVLDPESGKTPLHIGARFDVLSLHTCLRIRRCPVEVIATVANRHPEQLRELDENGSLPLHIAAANPNLNGAQDGSEDLISKWVRLYPEAAAAPDGKGRFPLILAIESGKKWEEGVEALTVAAGHVITVRDEVTNLYPFMLAATGDNACLTTVYCLLRRCPEFKRYVLD